jgi:hypothetical protein
VAPLSPPSPGDADATGSSPDESASKLTIRPALRLATFVHAARLPGETI